jgi:hypothetical protein
VFSHPAALQQAADLGRAEAPIERADLRLQAFCGAGRPHG